MPRELDTVVLRAVERDPEKRFVSAKEMGSALRRAVDVAPSAEIGDWLRAERPELLQMREKSVADLQRAIGTSGAAANGLGIPPARSSAPNVDPRGRDPRRDARRQPWNRSPGRLVESLVLDWSKSAASEGALGLSCAHAAPRARRDIVRDRDEAASDDRIVLFGAIDARSADIDGLIDRVIGAFERASCPRLDRDCSRGVIGACDDPNGRCQRRHRAQRFAREAGSKRPRRVAFLASVPHRSDDGQYRPHEVHGGMPMRSSSWIRLPAAGSAVIAIVLVASKDARAGEDCITAASDGQQVRDQGRLVEARGHFQRCAQSECPAPIPTYCGEWLSDVVRRSRRS